MSTDLAVEFWRSFQKEAPIIAALIAQERLREAFQIVEGLLSASGFDFCFELTEIDRDAAFVLTPEGDRAEAGRIDALLEVRPNIAGWRVFGRRQRKSLDDAFAVVRKIYGIDLEAATFELIPAAGGYSVTMFSPQVQGLDPSEADGLVRTFLDHAIGEMLVMSKISSVDVTPSGRGARSASGLVAELAGEERPSADD